MNKMYVILATGQDYFLAPCAIINSTCETEVIEMVKRNNPRAARNYRLAVERIYDADELEYYMNNGAIVCEYEKELMEAF